MFSIEKELRWEMGHRLMKHQGKCYNLHGHSYKAFITVSSEKLTDHGMVVDFYHFDPLKKWIDTEWDHGLMLNTEDPYAKILTNGPLWVKGICGVTVNRPLKIITVGNEPTAEFIAHELLWHAREVFKNITANSIFIDKVTVFETETSQATYKVERVKA